MRTQLLLMTLIAMPAVADARTWTIARDVYTAEAELVAVRGDVAYLNLGGTVEEVPIERLSAVDQQYIASLSLAPVLPGPMENPEVVAEEMPLPGEPDGPAIAPVYDAPLRQPPLPPTNYRVDRYGRAMPPAAANPANPWSANADRRAAASRNRGEAQDDDDERPGFFGARARRMERQRAAAASRAR